MANVAPNALLFQVMGTNTVVVLHFNTNDVIVNDAKATLPPLITGNVYYQKHLFGGGHVPIYCFRNTDIDTLITCNGDYYL